MCRARRVSKMRLDYKEIILTLLALFNRSVLKVILPKTNSAVTMVSDFLNKYTLYVVYAK